MKTCRVHITGASGAGVTSLGRALADALAMLASRYRRLLLAADESALSRDARGRRSSSADARGVPRSSGLGAERIARRLGRSHRSAVLIWWYFCTSRRRFVWSACVRARLGASVPMRSRPAARCISRRKNSSSGRRTTMTALARAAISRGIRHGWRRCRAASCVSTDAGQCPIWSRKCVCRSGIVAQNDVTRRDVDVREDDYGIK